MDEINTKSCPACGALCAPGAVGCSCGHVFGEDATVALPVEPPPVAAPSMDAGYPRPVYPPGFTPQTEAAPSVAERIIPTKNPKALTAYYCGVFSLVPCVTQPVLSPLAIIFGLLGLQECKKNPALPGKGHAITGVVLGGITLLFQFAVVLYIVSKPDRGTHLCGRPKMAAEALLDLPNSIRTR